MIGIIYIIGCMIATLIVIHEILKQNHNDNEDYDEGYNTNQYGLAAVVILLSWITVVVYCLGQLKKT
jgi:uncharacterized membrane protein